MCKEKKTTEKIDSAAGLCDIRTQTMDNSTATSQFLNLKMAVQFQIVFQLFILFIIIYSYKNWNIFVILQQTANSILYIFIDLFFPYKDNYRLMVFSTR